MSHEPCFLSQVLLRTIFRSTACYDRSTEKSLASGTEATAALSAAGAAGSMKPRKGAADVGRWEPIDEQA